MVDKHHNPCRASEWNGLPFARVLDGVNVPVCLDGWTIRPIIIGRGHEAYFAANPPGSQDTRVAQKFK